MLNDKCDISKSRIKFLGQVIEATEVCADHNKVNAVKVMTEPSNVSEVRCFLGIINHLRKWNSCPTLLRKTHPVRDLVRKSNMWAWGQQQQQAFTKIKKELTTQPSLALYDTNADTLVFKFVLLWHGGRPSPATKWNTLKAGSVWVKSTQ